MAIRLASIVCALLVAAMLVPAAALADGDPASDVLLGQNVFYPYQPPVSKSVAATLNAETAAAKRAGFPLKVALIASPVDLGVIPDLFGKPQKYADFLDQEISFQGKQPLLVVMAAGYGVQGLSGPGKLAVAGAQAARRQDQHRPRQRGDRRRGQDRRRLGPQADRASPAFRVQRRRQRGQLLDGDRGRCWPARRWWWRGR